MGGMITQPISSLPQGTAFARFVQLLARNKGSAWLSLPAAEKYTDSPTVALALRAAVEASTTGTAAPLTDYGVSREFLELLSAVGFVEKLKGRMFRVPFNAKSPTESTAPSANWVAEAAPVPVTSSAFGSVTLDTHKLGCVITLTAELIQQSGPPAESVIIRLLRNILAFTTDRKFLDATIAGVTDQNPSGITYGTTPIVTTGSTSAAIATDLSAMTNALVTWRDPVWIMLPKTLAYLNSRNDGNLLFYAGQQPMLLGLPVYTTLGSPAQITLVDVGSIAVAYDNALDVDTSRQATLEMDSAPAVGGQSPITDLGSLKSLWQNNYVAIKILRKISWQRAQTGCVVYMNVTY